MEDRYLFKAKRLDNGEWEASNQMYFQSALSGIYGALRALKLKLSEIYLTIRSY